MASIYIRKDSPYYWIRYYDVHEEEPEKRPKALPTKIEVTTADRSKRDSWELSGKKGKAPKPNGNNQTKDLLQRFISASVDLNIEAKTGLKVVPTIKLNKGFQEFLRSKPQLSASTVRSYELAERHLRTAISDKPIHSITHSDFDRLLVYFRQRKLSITTQAIMTRSLSAMFRYFYKKRYCEENVIIVIKAPRGDVEPIPEDDMKIILKYFQARQSDWKDERKKAEAREQYYLVYFLLLTGVRISTALAQTWEKIDLKEDIMTAINVKAKRKIFYFPVYPELKALLLEIKPSKGHLFSYSYRRGSPVFWKRAMKKLAKPDKNGVKKIAKEYHLHDLRKTFTSHMANSGVESSVLQTLLDHSDQRTTKDIYTKLEAKLLKSQFKNVVFKR